MSKIVIDNTETVEIEDKSGKTLIEGPLLDIHYRHAEIIAGRDGQSQKDKYTEVANVFMEEFRPGDPGKYTEYITWGTALNIALSLQQQVSAEKKVQTISRPRRHLRSLNHSLSGRNTHREKITAFRFHSPFSLSY